MAIALGDDEAAEAVRPGIDVMRSPARKPARAAGEPERTEITSESPITLRSDRPITSSAGGALAAAPPIAAAVVDAPAGDEPWRGSVSEACSGLPKRTIDSLI